MVRVKRGKIKHRKRRKIRKLSKGFWGGRKLYRTAKETLMRSLAYAYRDRKVKKREFRRLWIERINAEARNHGLTYSQFMHGLRISGIELDRKILAHLAVTQPQDFQRLVEIARESLENAGLKS